MCPSGSQNARNQFWWGMAGSPMSLAIWPRILRLLGCWPTGQKFQNVHWWDTTSFIHTPFNPTPNDPINPEKEDFKDIVGLEGSDSNQQFLLFSSTGRAIVMALCLSCIRLLIRPAVLLCVHASVNSSFKKLLRNC